MNELQLLCNAYTEAYAYGRPTTRDLWTSLLLLCRLDTLLPLLYKYRYDYGNCSGDGYPAAVYQLWRFVVARLLDTRIYRHSPRRLTYKTPIDTQKMVKI